MPIIFYVCFNDLRKVIKRKESGLQLLRLTISMVGGPLVFEFPLDANLIISSVLVGYDWTEYTVSPL